MRILVIEDDTKTGEYLKKGLGESGYAVDWSQHGADGLYLALENRYDLVVLDVMLPGLDGWQIMEVLRKKHDVPVLFLTARDQLQDRIRGLELGADDYLVKPFSFTELLLRIRTLLRRGVVREAEQVQLADLHLDVLRRKVSRQGQVIALTNKEFALLHLLMRREGEVLSRTLIASEVWDMNFDSDTNVVDVAIKRLRAKVDNPFPNKLIHTVRGIGYVCEERPCPPAAPDPLRGAAVRRGGGAGGQRGRFLPVPLGGRGDAAAQRRDGRRPGRALPQPAARQPHPGRAEGAPASVREHAR